MKIAFLCAMVFVALSSLPFVSHRASAVAQENPAAQIRTATCIPGPAAMQSPATSVKKLDAEPAKTDGACVVAAASASKLAQ